MKNRFISFLLASVMAVSMAIPVQAADRFQDVPKSFWAYTAIEELAEKGIVSGMGNGRFCPDDYVTTAQFVSMLTRLFYGEELEKDHKSYRHWYEKSMQQAVNKGILYGVDAGDAYRIGTEAKQKNAANSPVFREEMAVMAYNYLKKNAALPTEDTLRQVTAAKIPDLGNDATVFEQFAIASVYELGCLSGTDKNGTFRGDLLMTRAQACVVLSRMQDIAEAKHSRIGADWVKAVEGGKVSKVLKAPTLTNGLERNEYNVASRLNELRKTYPHGMSASDSNFFYIDPKTGRNTGNSGCYAFAMIAFDHVFGYQSLHGIREEVLTGANFGELKVGDHIRVKDLPHSVIVLQVNGDQVKVAEANRNGQMCWDTVYTKAQLLGYRKVIVQSAY